MGKHTSEQYKNYIAGQFGGHSKERLQRMLSRLLSLQKKELNNNVNIDKKEKPTNESEKKDIYKAEKEKVNKKLTSNEKDFYQRFKSNSYQYSLKLLLNSKETEYVKCIGIARLARYFGGWQPIDLIPKELFHKFFSICEISNYIIFDEERECQYFKVEKKEKRITEEDKE